MIDEFTRNSLAQLERTPYSTELLSRLGHAFANDKELARRAMETISKPFATLSNVWKRGQEIGAVRSDLPVALLISIIQSTKEALSRAYLPEGHVLTHEELGKLTDLQLDLIRRIASPATEKKP